VQEQVAQVHETLAKLPEKDRLVLEDYLYAGETSERQLALKHSLSRYALRNLLVASFGRVALELLRRRSQERSLEPEGEWDALAEGLGGSGRSLSADEIDRRLAFATWGEGRPAVAVAQRYDLPIQRVRAAQKRYVRRLMEALRGTSPKLRGSEAMNAMPLELLKNALFSPGNNDLLREVTAHAEDIHRALEETPTEFSVDEAQFLEQHPYWTGAVFQALAGPRQAPEQEQRVLEAIEQLRRDEDAEIAAAFARAIERLPREFGRWQAWFGKLPDVSEDYQYELRHMPVVKQTGEAAFGLIRYGLTPVTFIEAARGVQLLLDRLIHMALGPVEAFPEQPELRHFCQAVRSQRSAEGPLKLAVVLDRRPNGLGELPVVPRELAVSAVRSTIYGPPQTAEPLLHWLVEVAPLRPFLFAGYEAAALGKQAVRLKQDRVSRDEDLVWRWSREPEPALALAGAHL
jgi:hypothetical protein